MTVRTNLIAQWEGKSGNLIKLLVRFETFDWRGDLKSVFLDYLLRMTRSSRTYRLSSLLIAGAFLLSAAGPIVHYFCVPTGHEMYTAAHRATTTSEMPAGDVADVCLPMAQSSSDASDVEAANLKEAVVTRPTSIPVATRHLLAPSPAESIPLVFSSRPSAHFFLEDLTAGATSASVSLQVLNATFLL